MTQTIEEIFHLCKESLPEEWRWCTAHYKRARNDRTSVMVIYGLEADRTKEKNDFDCPAGVPTRLCELFQQYGNIIAPNPMEKPTHIELTIEPDGTFDSVLGYGEPNWDPSPRPWPDDIRAEEYTYTKAWPKGLKKGVKELLKDPRSLIGYD